MEQKQFKIYSFGRRSIDDKVITSENLDENIITISESFLTHALECYKNAKIEDGQLINEIIKVMLPASEEDAKAEWVNGLTFKNKKYFAWFATTGGMKKEDWGKCETIFVREDFYNFAKEFEDLISLGKFKEIEDSKDEVCINKDILSRLSLGTSNCYMAGDLPDIIVLPQPTFHIIKDYKTVEKFTKQVEDKNGELVDQVGYNLIDYHFDDDIDVFDGGGIATPKVFEQIKKELGVKYPVEFAIIRGYGIGIKGMITKFDILKYLNFAYKVDNDYCKKVEGTYYLLDMWNEWQPVTENTMFLNESMVKLAKYYKVENNENMETYKERLSNVDDKYKDIISKLYITKINKSDEDITDYRRTNYQLLNALVLTKKDYMELAKEDIKAYRKILKPFAKNDKDEWKANIDNIRLFFKSIITDAYEKDSEEEIAINAAKKNIVNKAEELLNISEDFIHLKYVKNNLARLIEKKCRELACGKLTVKAKYQYIAIDPISYINYAIYRDQKDNGLKAGEFYSADCNNGDIRTIARNPLCAYSEIHNVNFVRNAFLDNYLSPCRELIYFNQKSDILALMSSADADGDACTVIESDIIKEAVLLPKEGKYFINKDDGHKELMQYNFENRFYATYRASGNLIGSIALKSARINSDSQQTYDYYDIVHKKFELYDRFSENEREAKEAYEKEKNEKLESGEWLTTYKAGEQHREYMKKRFYENEKDIYIVLYNAMVSIDAPKTLYFPTKADMEVINKNYGRKAWFLQYKENREDVNINNYQYTFGLLDEFTHVVKRELLNVIYEINTSFDNKADLIQNKLINGDYSISSYKDCFDEITKIYSEYTKARETINKECYKKINKENRYRYEMIDNQAWSQWEDEECDATIAKYKKERYKQYKEVDAKYIVIAEKVLKKYDIATIANSIGNLKNCAEDFIINLFYTVFEYLNSKLQNDRYTYIKSKDGDINYLHEKYKKIPYKVIDNSTIVKNLHLEEKKRLKAIDVKNDIRARVLDAEVIGLIQLDLKTNGYIYFDIRISENTVLLIKDGKEMLEVFNDWIQINEYNLLKCSRIKFEILVEIAKTKKSLKLTATEITV